MSLNVGCLPYAVEKHSAIQPVIQPVQSEHYDYVDDDNDEIRIDRIRRDAKIPWIDIWWFF